jgi:hypothetical protein
MCPPSCLRARGAHGSQPITIFFLGNRCVRFDPVASTDGAPPRREKVIPIALQRQRAPKPRGRARLSSSKHAVQSPVPLPLSSVPTPPSRDDSRSTRIYDRNRVAFGANTRLVTSLRRARVQSRTSLTIASRLFGNCVFGSQHRYDVNTRVTELCGAFGFAGVRRFLIVVGKTALPDVGRRAGGEWVPHPKPACRFEVQVGRAVRVALERRATG